MKKIVFVVSTKKNNEWKTTLTSNFKDVVVNHGKTLVHLKKVDEYQITPKLVKL